MPGGWISDTTPAFTMTANGSDPGLGVRKITFTREGSPNSYERPVGCNGTAASRCPTNRTEQFNLSALSFDEGKKNATVTVEDATGKKSTHTWQTYVDMTKPDVTLSGQLAVATEEGEGDAKDKEMWDELSLPVYNLDIKATDIGTEANADHRKRSGVRKIEVLLDGAKKEQWEQACPTSSCSMEKVFPLKLNNLSADKHVLKVIATDWVGKKREREIEFEYIPATGMKDGYAMHYFPLPDGEGNEAEEENPARPELAVNVMNGNLVYRERDVEITGHGVDLEVERYYNSLLPEEENSEWGDGWTLAQTPDLDPEEGSGAPTEATMVRSSGAVEGSVTLPASVGEEEFDPELQAVVTKEAGGGYEVEDVSGNGEAELEFDAQGRVDEMRADSSAAVDYAYEEGILSQLSIEDPATAIVDPEELTPPPTRIAPQISHVLSLGTSGQGDGQLDAPADVAVDSQGNLWVLDRANNRVEKFSPSGQFLAKFGGLGSGDGQFKQPTALAIDPAGNLWVVDQGNYRVQKFGPGGQFLSKFGSEGFAAGKLMVPNGIAIGVDGTIWVSDPFKVQRFTPAGEFIERVGTSGSAPGQISGSQGLAVDSSGNVYVAEITNDRISVFDKDGDYLRQFGSAGTGPGQFTDPTEVEVDEGGNVWVGDAQTDRVQLFNSAGEHIASFGSSGSGAGQFGFDPWMGIASDGQGRVWISDPDNDRVQMWLAGHYSSSPEGAPKEDDPKVEVEATAGLVESVEGAEAGTLTYAHDGDLLTAVNGPDGETTYQYDSAGRMTRVVLPNGTWAQIEYGSTDGRVKKVTVDPAGAPAAKATSFTYKDQPRSTTVILPEAPALTYDIGNDGSILKWQNALKPPEFEVISGSLYDVENKETAGAIAVGEYNLVVKAYSEEGIASIQVYANGDQLISEKDCPQVYEEPTACKKLPDEWVTYTGNHAPGILNLEMVIEDRIGQVASKRFWVNIPYTPPPPPDQSTTPRFAEVLQFREEHGLDLDLDPVQNELEINDRVFDTINDWIQGDPVAEASRERWGVPLRAPEVAELDYRLEHLPRLGTAIQGWAQEHANSSFAGYYLDERAGGLIRVGFTSDQATRVTEIVQSGLLSASSRVVGFTTEPKSSLAILESLKSEIVAAAGSYPNGAITRVAIDVKANVLQVGSTNVSLAASLLAGDFGASAPLVVFGSPTPEPRAGRYRVKGPMMAGDNVWTKEPSEAEYGCTAGFGAFDRAAEPITGRPVWRMFFLTAAHCALEIPGSISYRTSVPGEAGKKQRQKLGSIKRTGWDANPSNLDLDIEAVRFEGVSGIEPRRIYGEVAPVDVTGVGLVQVGTRVCFSGVTTDELFPSGVKCGPVFDLESFSLEGHAAVEWCFDRRSIEGDSGGPVWIEGTGTAVGILSSGTNTATCFSPLLPDPARPNVPGAFSDARIMPLDGITTR